MDINDALQSKFHPCFFIFLVFFSFLVVEQPLSALGCLCEQEQWWIRGDYLLWKAKKAPLPVPLVTSAILTDPLPGALGQPGTTVLMGDEKINSRWQSGFNLNAGLWLDALQQINIEGSYFLLPEVTQKQSIFTSGEPGSINVAVPIEDVSGLWGLGGTPGESIFILPGPIFGPGFQGSFQLKTSIQLQGAELNGTIRLVDRCSFWLNFIGGYRWLQLQESLLFIGQTIAVPNADFSGFYDFKDRFKTNNNFYGGQLGIKAAYTTEMWQVLGFTKVALGSMNQKAKISGSSRTSGGNLFYLTHNTADEVLPGGIFAEPTNEGSHRRNAFAVAVEAGIKGFYKLSQCLEIGIGYNFLWATPVLRPGDQIDRKINPTRTALAAASRESVGVGPAVPIPFGDKSLPASLPAGPHVPKYPHRSTNFWVQGLTIDLNFKL